MSKKQKHIGTYLIILSVFVIFFIFLFYLRETKHIHYSVLVFWFGVGGLIGELAGSSGLFSGIRPDTEYGLPDVI